jgi:hypothetical protein
VTEDENQFLKIKKMIDDIESKKKLEHNLREKGPAIGEEVQHDRTIRMLRREAESIRNELVRQLKMSFKHIVGMAEARSGETHKSEIERYETAEADKVVERRILVPSNRIIDCTKGVEDLFVRNKNFDKYMVNFR